MIIIGNKKGTRDYGTVVSNVKHGLAPWQKMVKADEPNEDDVIDLANDTNSDWIKRVDDGKNRDEELETHAQLAQKSKDEHIQ